MRYLIQPGFQIDSFQHLGRSIKCRHQIDPINGIARNLFVLKYSAPQKKNHSVVFFFGGGGIGSYHVINILIYRHDGCL